jgi:snail 2
MEDQMDVVEPENLSTKPQDLSVRRSESPMSPAPLVISTTPSPPPPALLPTPPPTLHHPHPFYLKASGGVLEPLSLNTPVASAEQLCWPPMSHHPHQPRHHHIHQHQHQQHPHQHPHHHQFYYHPTVAPAAIRRPAVTTLYPPPALSPYAPPRAASSSPPAHRLYTAAFAPPFPGEGHQELNLLSPSSSSASSTEILGVEDLSRPAKGKAAPGGARYSCQSCSKSYASFSHLSKHRALHCPAAAAATSPLSDDDHANNNNGAPPKSFSCKYCEKTYVSLGALKMHIRTHTLPCKCKLCGKAFSRPWLLQGHIRTHTGEKPFSCQHCRRAFADRSNLRAHLQTHSDVKKYSCQHCSKTFSRMSLLGKHIDGGCPGLSQHAVDSIIMQQQHQMQPVH